MHIFNSIFLLTRHSSVFKSYPKIDQPQSTGEESLLTRDVSLLFVQRFVQVFHQNGK